MKIAEITSFRKETKKGQRKATFSVVLNVDGFNLVITGCAVVEGKNGLFVSLPATKTKKGDWRNIVYFKEGREAFDDFSASVLEMVKDKLDEELPF
jgi:DNA-binding cell septation regulator SpoVG